MRETALARVLSFAVFADDEPVEGGCGGVSVGRWWKMACGGAGLFVGKSGRTGVFGHACQRCGHAWKDADRARVDVLVQLFADGQNKTPEADVVGYGFCLISRVHCIVLLLSPSLVG